MPEQQERPYTLYVASLRDRVVPAEAGVYLGWRELARIIQRAPRDQEIEDQLEMRLADEIDTYKQGPNAHIQIMGRVRVYECFDRESAELTADLDPILPGDVR